LFWACSKTRQGWEDAQGALYFEKGGDARQANVILVGVIDLK
jgi:hypothetical protein